MGSEENKKRNITVFYDGECPMCTAFVRKVKASPQNEDFEYSDATKVPLPRGIEKDAVMKEIHAIDNQGKIYKNVDVIFKILETSRRYRFLVIFGRLPVIRQVLLLIYRIVAHNRHNIFGRTGGAF